ncbi:metal transporter [Mesorhizobium sp. B2-4-19]|uniref:metal transporter n=1 Tax=Mesorhizobium sp. B2-4-19 TaxID=2589930 RepID=UPI00112EF67C|nr:metal transporter [Mesorhizobium sp. B2-4-19]TPK54861.1 metal transporter [Mesorhizobium sp. B2-4-19]
MSTLGRRLLLALVPTGAAALVAWGWLSYQPAPSIAAPVATPASRVSSEDGLTIVTLDEATQKRSGIATDALTATKRQLDETAYGSVLDLQPLIDLQTRYRAAVAEVASAQAALDASSQEAERNRVLFKDHMNISQKAMQAAQAAWSADLAKLQSAEASLEGARASAQQQFGPPIASLITGKDTALAGLLEGQDMMLRIVLPIDSNTPAPDQITFDGGARGRLTARLISASPQSDPIAEGPTFLYRAPASLPVGSKVIAFLPVGQQPARGIVIPRTAVLWFGGLPWAYIQQGKDRFVRRLVDEQSPYDGGYFVDAGFEAGERVVTRGAQLLLSEEQRPPVTAAAACKDPECDD